MKTIRPKRLRYSKRSISLSTGVISKIIPKRGYKSFKTLHVNKHGSKKKHKCSPKPLTPYASWYKMFGYKDLDELYQIIKRGKYREEV
jgi:hypothetical protein